MSVCIILFFESITYLFQVRQFPFALSSNKYRNILIFKMFYVTFVKKITIDNVG